MEDNDVRTDMAHGRIDGAYEILDDTAKEYNDQFDDDEEEHLEEALHHIGCVMGTLMGAEEMDETERLQDDLDDIECASGAISRVCVVAESDFSFPEVTVKEGRKIPEQVMDELRDRGWNVIHVTSSKVRFGHEDY